MNYKRVQFSLQEIIEKTENIKFSAESQLEEITGSVNEAKSNEKLINSFAQKVLEREEKIDELKKETDQYEEKLKNFENEKKNYLRQAKELIENAKLALNYTTAQGISAAFQSYYDNVVKSKVLRNWLIGAMANLVITIGIGIWVMVSKSDNVAIILGRIALLPFPIGGAIFCAKQFVKQKNILEDYAYKMVLSKSIVGFSEQIKKNGSENNQEYLSYIEKVLIEIHKDPLRKRANTSKNNKKSTQDELIANIGALKKILDLTGGQE